jgi:hypothetical protein
LIVQTIFSKCFALSSCVATEEKGGKGNQIGPRASSPELPRPPYFHENTTTTTTTTYNLVVHQNSTSDFLTKNIFFCFMKHSPKEGVTSRRKGTVMSVTPGNSAEFGFKQQLPKKSGKWVMLRHNNIKSQEKMVQF